MVQQIWASRIVDFIKNRNCFVMDLRSVEAFRRGHLPKAVQVDAEDVEENRFTFSKDVPIVVYCDEGSVSLRISRILSMRGYYVYNLAGGYDAYQRYQEKMGKG